MNGVLTNRKIENKFRSVTMMFGRCGDTRRSERIEISMLRKYDLVDYGPAVQMCLLGGLVLAIVFLTPDAGRQTHQTFFAVAHQSLWNHFAEWAAAWCSVKIVLLGIGVLVMLDALGSLMIRMNNDVLGIGLLCLGVLPVLLSMFGFFELVKALL